MMKKNIALVLALVMGLCFSTSSDAYAKEDAKKLDIVPVTMDSTGYRTAVITTDGALWMWGGQVTTENPSFAKKPVKIMEKDVVSVSCSSFHTAVIKNDGSLWMWGDNEYGQIGLGKKGAKYIEKPTKVMDDVIYVSCGNWHTAVIKTDGSLWMFGNNQDGQIGNGYIGDVTIKAKDWLDRPIEYPIQTAPVKIMDDVILVSCGMDITAAVKADGSLWWWGEKANDRLQIAPVKIMDDVTSVSCGDNHAAAVKKDGSLWMWGVNGFGCLGVGSDIIKGEYGTNATDVPTKVMDDVVTVKCASYVTAVMKTDGSLWMWGQNASGIMGSSYSVVEPTKVLDKCSSFIPGGEGVAAFIIKDEEVLYGLGEKLYLGIGSNSDENQLEPVKILGDIMLLDIPSTTARQEVDAAIEAGLVPKSLQKNYQKLITRGNLEKLLTQLIKQVGKDADVREIVTDSDGTFNPKGKVTESRFVTVIKRTAKALGVKYKSFGLKKTKTKLTTERAIVMAYRAYNMLIR